MVDRILYDIDAQKALDKAKCFFESIDKGNEFLDDYENQIALLMRMPDAFQLRYRDVRIIAFEHFSYSIHYVFRDRVIYILDILNQHQRY